MIDWLACSGAASASTLAGWNNTHSHTHRFCCFKSTISISSPFSDMWRSAFRKSSRRLGSIREQSFLPCHGSCPNNSLNIKIYENPDASRYCRLFDFNSVKPTSGRGRGRVNSPLTRSDLYATAFNSAVHMPLPWCGRIESNGLSGGMGMDPPWLLPGGKAFASTAAEVVVSSDMDEEAASTISRGVGVEECGMMRQGKQSQEKDKDREEHNNNINTNKNKYRMLRRRQMKAETEAWQQAVEEYKELLADMCANKLAPNLPYMKSLLLGWFEPLRDAIAAEQQKFENSKWRTSYSIYFCELPADMMAVITMHKMVALMMTEEENACVRLVSSAMQIGEAIEHEVRIHKFLEKTKKKSKRQKQVEAEQQEQITKEEEFLRKRVTDLMKKQKGRQARQLVKRKDVAKPWRRDIQAKVGSRLIEILLQTAFIQLDDQPGEGSPNVEPAFKHTTKTNTIGNVVRSHGVIQCNPLLRRGLDRTARNMVMPYMPMLVTPRPWKGYSNGGYLFLHSFVMRTHGAKEQRDTMWRVPMNQIKQVYEALDILGSTKWRVNKRILDVVDRIWAGGGCLGGLVEREDVSLPKMPDTEDESEIRRWKWRLKKAKKINNERHSQRCDIELKLGVARKMRDEDCFYYPHNLDFRGRAYPMHPHLNHLGSDMCRGILEFAEGRPLGKAGLLWLKIHLANLFATGGVDKLSHDGRLAFVEDNINNIFDSAERPLEGKRWWLEAEDPFQCLSACMYLSDALKSPSPESVICHLPVHQDGSCNGLQHYAALGRDKEGAAAVNLIHCERPADVYTGIADRVDKIMRKDALEDPATNCNAECARLLLGQVDRKLVKQTVMTSVYGVTYIGARDQILKRLKERGSIADDKALYTASCYAAKTTLTALGEMFNSARDIMTWLGDCARIIAAENKSVRWNTPLGLPVVQPYKKYKLQRVRTSLQVLALKQETDKVMVNRQKTAFPPNFVHSLDGSHMMMTAIACKAAGLTFAGVHDSYWTHACDVDKMNQILREKFVELYSKPILENLLEYFEATFPHMSFPPLPDRSDFDIKEVLNSPYFFN